MNISHKLLNFIISTVIAISIISLSYYENHWLAFWTFLNVPSQLPPFSDLDSINRALLSLNQGFNPYLENPNDISQTKYMYPKIWLYIFDILNLKNAINFKIFCFVTIFLYSYSILNFSSVFKMKYLKIIIILFFLSTSNFILLERLNIEIIIFIISWLLLSTTNLFKELIMFTLIVLLKIFPIFSILAFINDKKKFLTVFLSTVLIILIFYKDISLMRSNMIEYALIVAYGIGSMAKALYYYSVHLDYFINDSNYFIFRNILILLGICFSLIIFLTKFELGKKYKYDQMDLDEKSLLFGGGIYIGTYITSANIDYRLIFLLFTIPYVLNNLKNYYNFCYIFCFLVCINSFLFEGGNNYSFEYLIKAILVYGMKFYIFTYLLINFGKVINKYVVIDFKNFKFIN